MQFRSMKWNDVLHDMISDLYLLSTVIHWAHCVVLCCVMLCCVVLYYIFMF